MKENLIQNGILHYLQIKENIGELYFFRSSAGAVRINGGPGKKDRFFKTGKPGTPDITVCKNGKFYGLEVKTEKGKQSEKQKQAEEKIKKAGGEYYIVRSIKDVINLGF